MISPTFARGLLVPLFSLLILPHVVNGATAVKADNTIDLRLPESWVGGSIPGNFDTVIWSSIVTGPNTVGSVGAMNYLGMVINDPGGPVTLTGHLLGIGASGIDMPDATQDLTINTTVLSVNSTVPQQWRIASGRAVTVNSQLMGNATTLAISGGTVTLSGTTANDNPVVLIVGGSAANPGLLLLNKQNAQAIGGTSGGTRLRIEAFGTARLTGTGGTLISDNSNVAVNGGTFDLNGRTETINGLSGSGGKVTNSSATTATLAVATVAGSSTFDGVIEDGAGLVNLLKQGANTLTLSATSTFTGQTNITGGTLAVTGSIQGSAVALANGATLVGDGIVGPLTAAAGTTISPGVSSAATLDVAGPLTLDGGTLKLELNGPALGSYDQLTTTGSVALLSNVPVDLTLGFSPNSDSFTILNNQSATAISGSGLFTFNGEPLSEGEHFLLGGYDTVITYQGGTGNDVVIAVPEPGSGSLLLLGALTLACRRRAR